MLPENGVAKPAFQHPPSRLGSSEIIDDQVPESTVSASAPRVYDRIEPLLIRKQLSVVAKTLLARRASPAQDVFAKEETSSPNSRYVPCFSWLCTAGVIDLKDPASRVSLLAANVSHVKLCLRL